MSQNLLLSRLQCLEKKCWGNKVSKRIPLTVTDIQRAGISQKFPCLYDVLYPGSFENKVPPADKIVFDAKVSLAMLC